MVTGPSLTRLTFMSAIYFMEDFSGAPQGSVISFLPFERLFMVCGIPQGKLRTSRAKQSVGENTARVTYSLVTDRLL
jgi:hypothetical protein